MTFTLLETSRRQGQPVNLYLFIFGGEEGDSPAPLYFGYTDAEQQIVDNGFTYEPVPVMRERIHSTGSLDKGGLPLRLPRDIEFAERFRVYPPSQVVTLIIRQGHLSDLPTPQFLVCWSGRVLSVGREGDQCVIVGEPISSSLRRPGLRRHYQIGCPHVLYSQGEGLCNANEAAATVTATVDSVSTTSVTLVAGWEGAFAAVKFVEGMLKWLNDDSQIEIRKILSISGNVLSLGGFTRDLLAAMSVSVVLGCNHRKDATDDGDCLPLHNNIQNYGGCDWIPIKNPIGYRNQYY